jgi:anthranilate synthase component 1
VVTFGRLDGKQLQVQKLATSENQFELFKKLYSLYDKIFILESLVGPKELAEMSVIGFDPEITVTCTSQKFTVQDS